jgi:aminomethyltransferase
LELAISISTRDPKRTPLYERHVQHGARMVDFAGWTMPVQYDGVFKEHERVRSAVGLFDVSHMGELFFSGAGAQATLDNLATNNVAALRDGQALYTPLCNENGGVLDDVLVYRINERRFMMVVNAANTPKIVRWSKENLGPGAEVEDASDAVALLAVQGPRSGDLLRQLPALHDRGFDLDALEYYHFLGNGQGDILFLSRTGYTGELGYELYVRPERAGTLWDEILSAGQGLGVGPVGLGARDTLRFEVGFCLYGHELDEQITPLEAGLAWTVKLKKGRFLGRSALARQKEQGVPRRIVGLEVRQRVIARAGYEVHTGGQHVGSVTSGTFSPTLKRSLAMALVQREALDEAFNNEACNIIVRGREVPAERVSLPFYKPTPPR